MTKAFEPTLAVRWIGAAKADSSSDPAIVTIVERSLKGESVNEFALLKALLSHAEASSAESGDHLDAKAAG